MNSRIQALVDALSGKKKKPESMPESMKKPMPESAPFGGKKRSEYELNKKEEEDENLDMKYPTYEDEEGKPYKALDDESMNDEGESTDPDMADEDKEPMHRKGLFSGNGKGLSIIIQMGRKRG